MVGEYRHHYFITAVVLVILNFFIGHMIPSTPLIRWVLIVTILVIGLYMPEKPRDKQKDEHN